MDQVRIGTQCRQPLEDGAHFGRADGLLLGGLQSHGLGVPGQILPLEIGGNHTLGDQ